MNRYINLEKIGVRLETPKVKKITEQDIGEFKIITVNAGERLDNIAYDQYNDPYLWWVLAEINSLKTPFIQERRNLVIPIDINTIVSKLI